jgi:hypothetical protein
MNDTTGFDLQLAAPAERSLGARLRAARQARGMGLAEAAAALHAPVRIIEAIEADDLDRMGAPVYSRGYLTSYARLLGLPQAVVDVALAQRVELTLPSQSALHVPRSRVVGDRLARMGAYLALTVSLVTPFVYSATQDEVPVDEPGLRSLDAPGAYEAPPDDSMVSINARLEDHARGAPADDAEMDGPLLGATHIQDAPPLATDSVEGDSL